MAGAINGAEEPYGEAWLKHMSERPIGELIAQIKTTELKLAATMAGKRGFKTVEKGTRYELPVYRVVDGKGIEETGETLSLKFVRGSKLADENVEKREGTLHEHLLSCMIEDLKFKMSLVPSDETKLVVTHLQEAQHWLEEREKARTAAGVVGTYQPHKS